ncbi:MAG: metallophosphoesterase [Planctomycetota bacterium]
MALVIVAVTVSLIGFEAYTLAVVHLGEQAALPENIGNFERIRNSLKEQGPHEKFSFAVVGDTRATRTFERLSDKLRNEPLSFMVILGDFVETFTRGNHDYFKFECTHKYNLPFPVFLVAGNHDVVCKEKDYDFDGVSLTDFEKMYGPRNFSFEYNGCLFVGLCVLPPPFATGESIEFLESALAGRREKNQRVFVFTHMPVIRSTGPVPNSFENMEAFTDVVDRYNVDYVISAHYHGYDRTRHNDTVYLVTGGGGAPLDEEETFGGLNHAVVLTVDRDSVSERTVFARHSAGVTSAVKHFAIAKLAPFLRKHPALTIVENVLVFGMFCVSLFGLIRSGIAVPLVVGPRVRPQIRA